MIESRLYVKIVDKMRHIIGSYDYLQIPIAKEAEIEDITNTGKVIMLHSITPGQNWSFRMPMKGNNDIYQHIKNSSQVSFEFVYSANSLSYFLDCEVVDVINVDATKFADCEAIVIVSLNDAKSIR